MIEIPEGLILARQLNETVKGKRIKEVETEHTKHGFTWYEGDPKSYPDLMEGSVFGESIGIGSMVDMSLSEYQFVIGDGTNIRYFAPGRKLPDRYQTRVTLEDDSSLILSVQMYGGIFLFRQSAYENTYYWVGKEKPMPGTKEFDRAYFDSLRNEVSDKLSIKAFLATQQRIPGLGNGVLQDILLEAGQHPKRKLSTMSETDWDSTYTAILKVLSRMEALGGRDTEKTLFGESGQYQTMLSKKTYGGPCQKCGHFIEKASYLGGTVYFCPKCQKLS